MSLRDRTKEAVDEFRRATLARKRGELETAMDLTAMEAISPTLRGTIAGMTIIDEIIPKGEPVTTSPENNDIISAINTAIKGKPEQVFQIVGPIATSIKLPTGDYKTHKFKGGEELLFRGVRVGKRDEFIFEFEPLDAQEFNQVEFGEKKVFAPLIGFEKAMVGMLMPGADEGLTWHAAVVGYRANIEAEKKLAEEAAAAARLGDQTHKNPNYGMFA